MGRGGINKFGLPIPCRGSEGCNYLLKMWLVNYSKLINTYPTSVLSLSVLFLKKNFSFSVPKMDGQTERNAHFWFQMPCLLYRWCAAWLGVYIYLLFSFLLGLSWAIIWGVGLICWGGEPAPSHWGTTSTVEVIVLLSHPHFLSCV